MVVIARRADPRRRDCSVKTLEGFDFDAQSSVRLQVVALAYGAPWAAARNVVLLRPTGTGRPTWPPPLEVQAAQAGEASCSPPRPTGSSDWPACTGGHLSRDLARLRRYGLSI